MIFSAYYLFINIFCVILFVYPGSRHCACAETLKCDLLNILKLTCELSIKLRYPSIIIQYPSFKFLLICFESLSKLLPRSVDLDICRIDPGYSIYSSDFPGFSQLGI